MCIGLSCDLKAKLKLKKDAKAGGLNKDFKVERDEDGQRINIDFTHQGMNSQQIKFLLETIEFIEGQINNPEYRQAFYDMDARPYRHSRTGRIITRGIIWRDLTDGDFIGDKLEDNSIDLIYTLYSSARRRTIGYTSMSTGRVHTNKYHFDKWMKRGDYGSLGGHLWHELIHSDGYRHQGSHDRCFIYRAGYLMRDFIRKAV